MTFYEPGRKFPIAAIFILLIIGGVGGTIFFSLKECNSSGILRSGKTSDATELYQVFPVKNGNNFQLISLEGVFKTRIYERQGGITTRSGSTDVRLTIHDLKSGSELTRIVLGDYHEAYTKILGAGNNVIWLYNAKDGLHSRSTVDLKTMASQDLMIKANKDLSEGLAKADPYLGNLDELYAYYAQSNKLMVTTISGKSIWIDADKFGTETAPAVETKKTDLEEMVNDIFEQAKHGVPVDINNLSSKIIEMASDMTSFSDIDHEADRVLGFDSCEYNFEGQTVRTLTKSNCPEPKKINTAENETGKTYIEPAFLSYYNTETKQYTNPVFLGTANFLMLYAKSIGSNTDLLLSKLDAKTLRPVWTTKTGIVLENQRSGYQVNGIFGNEDTLVVCIDNFLYSINLINGKILWKTTIGKNDYNEQLFFVGDAIQNGKHYFLTANNYFTVLSREGIFIHGRTDYKLMVMEGSGGKIVKKIEVTDSKPESLPYYLGMSNGKCWFYSKSLGIHARTLPDLKPEPPSFFELIKNAGINSEPVISTGFDDAIENKYIAFDEKSNSAYFTTENGLHYQYNLVSGKIAEVSPPSDQNYEDFMRENSHVNFYRMHLSYMYQHELFFADGRSVETVSNNSTSALKLNEVITKQQDQSAQLKTNQFIDGKILTNGVSISGSPLVTDNNRTPLATTGNENNLYILHKDKISPEAHLMISKYDASKETVAWKIDIHEILLAEGEITRIFTLDNQLIFIFKTHPDLDDFFTCVSLNSETGKINWKYKF